MVRASWRASVVGKSQAVISDDAPLELARINVARLLAPLDSPQLKDFVDALEPVNADAEAADGFLWRLKGEGADVTDLRAFDDEWIIVNMSVWRDAEALHAYMYSGRHREFLGRRREFFSRLSRSATTLWWCPPVIGPPRPRARRGCVTCGITVRRRPPSSCGGLCRRSWPGWSRRRGREVADIAVSGADRARYRPGVLEHRQVRASYDDETVTVYQAYSPAIAGPAVAAGRFVPPFKRERTTWIKPSFLWMMYRCGWATKAGQERVLAVRITRAGFEEALAEACLSHFDRRVYPDAVAWSRRMRDTEVRVQWDPERDPSGAPLEHRSLQVGLGGGAAGRYVDEWLIGIEDVTALVCELREARRDDPTLGGGAMVPVERLYPLPPEVAVVIGASPG